MVAVLWLFAAFRLAHRGALGLVSEPLTPLVEQALLVFLLVFGYASMGMVFDRQLHPFSEQGLPRRPGCGRELGLGVAVGWTLAVVCVLPMLIIGGIAIVLNLGPSAWTWLVADVAFFALAALAEEVAFRGYGFQRLAQAMGPAGAVVGYAAIYGFIEARIPGSNRISVAIAIVFSVMLSMAYLRTRALWVSWGLNFSWKASRALIFGLAVSGVSSHSPVVEGNPMGPFWLTGGGFGLDGSWITFFVLLVSLIVVYRLTSDLDYRYNVPVIVPGGIPVDLDAATRKLHDSAMGVPEAVPSLVQIQPVSAPQINSELDSANNPRSAG
jgi:membrane protease YdiL (CAAX protease family)